LFGGDTGTSGGVSAAAVVIIDSIRNEGGTGEMCGIQEDRWWHFQRKIVCKATNPIVKVRRALLRGIVSRTTRALLFAITFMMANTGNKCIQRQKRSILNRNILPNDKK
jgi:hypothetical protein